MDPSLIGALAGILCTASFVPQVVLIYKTKNTAGLSMTTFLIFSSGVFLWMVYGIVMHDVPLILANATTLVLAFCIIAMKIKYK